METIIEHITTLLHREDIEGLIANGAPADEYNSEALEISQALAHIVPAQQTEETIAATIALVWARSFNRNDTEMQLRLPAIRIIAADLAR